MRLPVRRGPATEEASGSGHRPAEEEDGELPRLPLDAFHFLLPRFLVLVGDGNPKGYFLKHLGNDFLKWFRAVVPEYRGYRNAWPPGQMRRFCEECPGTDVLDIPLESGGTGAIVRLLPGINPEWPSDDVPLPPGPRRGRRGGGDDQGGWGGGSSGPKKKNKGRLLRVVRAGPLLGGALRG